ncbi:hypothetical protein A5784_10475 [Mycobacterium sp. 852013-50091_SCH5140682]|nr:hypothetical protein A5784_10475 [Mycobacterium sp. 852013-50091_SCH5140682]
MSAPRHASRQRHFAHARATVRVQEAAVDGKANDAVTKVLAAHLGVPRNRVELISGATARLKRFRIT